MVDLDESELEAQARTPCTKTELDLEVAELPYDRRLAMAARRRGGPGRLLRDLLDPALLRELARAADFEVSAASPFLDAESEQP